MKTIVAPTDFSANSLNAVNYAADMACMINAKLILMHVFGIPVPVAEVPLPAFSLEDIAVSADDQLKELKAKLLDRTGNKINIQYAARSGDIVAEIVDYCDNIKPTAVVMGAETAGTFERFFFGGETVKSVQQLKWPLIIVPPQVTFKQINKIGLASDFREVVETVRIQELKALVEQFNAELHVLHVREVGEGFRPEAVEESALLNEMLGGLNPKYHIMHGVEVEKVINDFADNNDIDLLTVIPKTHNLFEKLFKHSYSEQLVLQAHVPVLVIHE